MSDKQIFTAYVTSGTQLLRYEFEYPIVEYWAEDEEQKRLRLYFKSNHHTHDLPVSIEASDTVDFMPYKEQL